MSTENIYSPTYRKKYFEGYSSGINPYVQIENNNKEAFNSGFISGRMDYESMNGSISIGIPDKIVAKKVLEDFLLAGLLGLSIDTEGYTPFQLSIIRKWYLSGVEKYDPNESIYLTRILEKNGIFIY